MNAFQLIEVLQDLPPEMEVVLETPGDTFTTTCVEQSTIVECPIEDDSGEDGYTYEEVYVLRPCNCHQEKPVFPSPNQNLN